jgi:FAD-dependent urate hydroxylase
MQFHEAGIVGAGPYGLTAAAHLRARGINPKVFGEVMSFWNGMPKGMLLRSEWDGSHLFDPAAARSLNEYARAEPNALSTHITMPEFTRYGEWFQRQAVPEVDPRRVTMIARSPRGFRFTLADGDELETGRAIVATGLQAFARRLPALDGLPPGRTAHTSDERDFSEYAGRRVLVLGAGQSALESATLLNDAAATVEVITRNRELRWLAGSGHISRESGKLARLLYPPGAVGPLGINWAVQLPGLYRALPVGAQAKVFARALRPAGSGWLRDRFAGVTVTAGLALVSAEMQGDDVRVALSDGSARVVDHIVQGTGYHVDVNQYDFLSPEIKRDLMTIDDQPKLGAGFESSVPGLHFLGAASDLSFGPLMRFVAGTAYAGAAVTAVAVKTSASSRPAPVMGKRFAH